MEWQKTFDENRPQVKKHIILLTEDARVMRGYMNSSVWPGEEKPTYSFHGEYYDFSKNELCYCLINALAWMPLPDMPKIRSRIDEARQKVIESK